MNTLAAHTYPCEHMADSKHILVVDDDCEIRELLAIFLQDHGYTVSLAEDGVAMFALLQQVQPDLIVLDLMLPGEDGLSLCRRLSAETAIPVIMLTAVAEDTDRIVGLEMGADDYLTKPFNPRELLARIRAVLRRTGSAASTSQGMNLYFEGWQLDLGRHELKRSNGTLVPLSAGEFRLLQVLTEHPQQVLSRDFLLDRTHGRESGPYDRSVDIQLSRLRRKLEDDPKNPQLIKTVRSGGYMFSLPVSRSN
jgi:two-component system, OmpR family, response regulator